MCFQIVEEVNIILRHLTLESAIYAVPGGMLFMSNHSTTLLNVWPWALHIVVAYAEQNGYTVFCLPDVVIVTGCTGTSWSFGNLRTTV